MKALDRVLQQWRIAVIQPYLSKGARVLDIGCADGAFFDRCQGQVSEVIGIDPTLSQSVDKGRFRLIAGAFPDGLPDVGAFDAITMLAVLEHIPSDAQPRWAAACARLLKPGGHVLITTPSPVVDRILALLKTLRLIDGMSLEEHYGFEPRVVPSLFSRAQLELVRKRKFQLGCNNLFVFKKPISPSAS